MKAWGAALIGFGIGAGIVAIADDYQRNHPRPTFDPRFAMIFQMSCPSGEQCSANAMCSDGRQVWPARLGDKGIGSTCYSVDRPQ